MQGWTPPRDFPTFRTFEVRRLAGACGGEVSGLDLPTDLPDETIDDLRAAHVRRRGQVATHRFRGGATKPSELTTTTRYDFRLSASSARALIAPQSTRSSASSGRQPRWVRSARRASVSSMSRASACPWRASTAPSAVTAARA